MKSRLFLRIITVFLVIPLMISYLYAATPETVDPSASIYINSTSASSATGTVSGSIQVSFILSARINATTIGASTIRVYRYDGTPMKTIYGSTSNNLLTSGLNMYSYTYQIENLEPGTRYYAEVTLIAGDANGSDTRTVTTDEATAKL